MLPQLSTTARPLGRAVVGRLVGCDATTLLVARAGDVIVATLPLPLPLPDAARGRGIAGLLIEEALRLARQAGARTVGLTSRTDRAAANRLYERLGFEARRSTVYRCTPD